MLRESRWLSRSRDYSGTQHRAGTKLVRVELSESSKNLLAHDNMAALREQGMVGIKKAGKQS